MEWRCGHINIFNQNFLPVMSYTQRVLQMLADGRQTCWRKVLPRRSGWVQRLRDGTHMRSS